MVCIIGGNCITLYRYLCPHTVGYILHQEVVSTASVDTYSRSFTVVTDYVGY